MKIRLAPGSERDIEEALAWYDGKSEFLGDKFLQQVNACLKSIEKKPTMYRTVHR